MRWTGNDISAWKEPILWAIVACGLLFFSLACTFPYDVLQGRILGELKRATGIEMKAADWGVGFPPAIEWRQVTFNKADMSPIQLGRVRAQVGLWQLLTGGVALDLVAQTDETTASLGTAKVMVTSSSWSMTGPVTIAGKIQQLELPKLIQPYVTRGLLTGEFTQQVTLTAAPASLSLGDGDWKAEAKELSLEHIPVGNGRTIALVFSALSLRLACREQLCDITELKGDGIDGSFSGQGTIRLQQPVQQSQMALSLTVIPGMGFAAKSAGLGIPPLPAGTPIPFKLTGTLAQARVAL